MSLFRVEEVDYRHKSNAVFPSLSCEDGWTGENMIRESLSHRHAEDDSPKHNPLGYSERQTIN